MPNLIPFNPGDEQHVEKFLKDNHCLLKPDDVSSNTWHYSWFKGVGSIVARSEASGRRMFALMVHLVLAEVEPGLAYYLANLDRKFGDDRCSSRG